MQFAEELYGILINQEILMDAKQSAAMGEYIAVDLLKPSNT